jgi:hypothetical protein
VKAPVILFVYGRPEHTRRTIEALSANIGADETDLFVYSDAPKSDKFVGVVNEVREILKEIKGFKSVVVRHAASNKGLAQSIIDGVTEILNIYGRAIVLEDDLVTSTRFLEFMNNSLDRYEKVQSVWHISGYVYPVGCKLPEEGFFLRVPMCWGWATWRDRWGHFRKDLEYWRNEAPQLKAYIDFKGKADYYEQYELNCLKEINTWFIFWYLCLAQRKALAYFPATSLVENIGNDGSGVHKVRTTAFSAAGPGKASLGPMLYPLSVVESSVIVAAHASFLSTVGPPFRYKVRRWVARQWRRINAFWR